jgi:hypothetical protein
MEDPPTVLDAVHGDRDRARRDGEIAAVAGEHVTGVS